MQPGVQGENIFDVIPQREFSFLCSSQGAYTFIFSLTLSLHIFFNPPADTGAHLPEALHSLHCGHQSCRTANFRGLAFLFFPPSQLIFPSEIEFSKRVR